MMKRIILSFLFVLMALAVLAQTDNTIKFLGIPVDGKKSEMVSALMKKGFVYDANRNAMVGKFNGVMSIVLISEKYGKVDRVIVSDDCATRDQADIRIRYNNLISQFEKLNDRYYTIEPNERIPDNENISREIRFHKKKYQAIFFYIPIQNNQELANKVIEEAFAEVKERVDAEVLARKSEEEKLQMLIDLLGERITLMTTGYVWFTILEEHGRLSIAIYYENENNQPNGDEL